MRHGRFFSVLKRLIGGLLFCALFITASLLVNFIINLSPELDGFYMGTSIALLIHGDGFWTWEELRCGVLSAWNTTAVLLVLYMIVKALCGWINRDKKAVE